MDKQSINWILTDSRIGSNNQAIALAEELGLNYRIIKLEYNIIAKLPNWIIPLNFIQVKSPNILELLKQETPDLIISASRRTAIVSASIKKRVQNVKNIQILRPDLSFSNFDLVILPQHDKNIANKYDNVYRIIGALNNVNKKISDTLLDFERIYSEFTKNKYAVVLIGGNTKSFSFDKKSSSELHETLLNLIQYNNIKYFITYSRRTPDVVKEALKPLQNEGHIIYDPTTDASFNPYPAMLEKASFVVSTIDSVSMSSEVASTGKPFYLHIPRGFNSGKHLTFAYQLSDLGIAKLINNDNNHLQEYNYTCLNEVRKVADYILSSILSVK